MGFNIRDIIELTQDISFYDKGLICQVVEILSDEKINVRCLGRDGSTYDVDADIFELVPPDEVLTKGMYVKDDEVELFKFIGYRSNGIAVSHPTFWKDFIFYDDIRYINKFVV